MIKSIDFKKTEGLVKELEAFGDDKYSKDDIIKHFSNFTTLDDYITQNSSGQEVYNRVKKFKSSGKVLDLGVGGGYTSFTLAQKGFDVSIVDPSIKHCKVIEYGAKLYNLNINIYNCISEEIDKIDDEFDIIVFQSSLHHCDDPLKAVKNAYKKLKKNGYLFFINEPFLKFYKTKSMYYNNLLNNPIESGHYGGNEHIYRYSEYASFLKDSGFKKIISSPSEKYLSIKSTKKRITERESDLQSLANANNKKIKKKTLKKKFVVLYNIFLVLICNNSFFKFLFLPIFKKLSMINVDFIAMKTDSQ